MHHPTPAAAAHTDCPDLPPGARYSGAVLDAEGRAQHHLVLLAARPEQDLNWQAAKEWAASVGGDLPSPQEQALLFANCKDALPKAWCWSNKENEKDASSAWNCDFDDGLQISTHKSFEGSAVAVRRLPLEFFNSFVSGSSARVCTQPTDAEKIEAAAKAISHVLQRLQTDARIAYYFDPITESFDLLTKAHALLSGQPVEEIRAHQAQRMVFAPPTCRECGGAA